MSTNYVLSLQCKKALIKDTRNPRTFPFCHHGSILAFPDSWIYDIVSALAITITLVIVTTLDTNKQSALVSEAKTVRE